MKYQIKHNHRGEAIVVRDDGTQIPCTPACSAFVEFLVWNAAQPSPLDYSNRAPDPLPVDAEKEEIAAILAKRDADITAAESKTVGLRLARRLYARGLL